MATWLLKTEPETYSWQNLVDEGRSCWDHVRNYTARNHLKSMAVGDLAFFYHSGKEKAVVGICKVVRTYYPDPTAEADGEPPDRWVAVDVAPVKPLKVPVSLAAMKADPALQEMLVVRQGRLSVSPVSALKWRRVLALGS